MRKLFVALNNKGNKIHIDSIKDEENIEKNTENIYFCPYCKKEVIQKLSDMKENHFAHKDGKCGIELKTYEKTTKEINLSDFSSNKSNDENPFKKTMSSMSTVRCRICKDVLRIDNATKIKENIYLCKKCIPRIKEISDEII